MDSPWGVNPAPTEAPKKATSSGVKEYTATSAWSNQADKLSGRGFASKAKLCLAKGDGRDSVFEFVGVDAKGVKLLIGSKTVVESIDEMLHG
eukprot:2357798-Pyramimonas_sp.AAC.1